MKVYEIIDAHSKGWQLRETEGGLRKGLLIIPGRFEISVSHSLCQNAIKNPPTPTNTTPVKVTAMLLSLDESASFYLEKNQMRLASLHAGWGFLMEHE